MRKEFIETTTMLMSIFIACLLLWLVCLVYDLAYDMWMVKAQWQIFLRHYSNTLEVDVEYHGIQ